MPRSRATSPLSGASSASEALGARDPRYRRTQQAELANDNRYVLPLRTNRKQQLVLQPVRRVSGELIAASILLDESTPLNTIPTIVDGLRQVAVNQALIIKALQDGGLMER